jgi:hypothetical protein
MDIIKFSDFLFESKEEISVFMHNRLMAGYYETLVKQELTTAEDFLSSSDNELHASAEEHYDKARTYGDKQEEYSKEARRLFDARIHGSWNSTLPTQEDCENHFKSIHIQ